jgi:hypothetical protein
MSSWSTKTTAVPFWSITSTPGCGYLPVDTWNRASIPQTRREASEELGIDPIFAAPSGRPSFMTVTRTGGLDAGHIDVSLWFLLFGRRGMNLAIDLTEFNDVRWWSRAEVGAANPKIFDPHYVRFVEKVAQEPERAVYAESTCVNNHSATEPKTRTRAGLSEGTHRRRTGS